MVLSTQTAECSGRTHRSTQDGNDRMPGKTGWGRVTAREALWSTPGPLKPAHIRWHKALFHLELGQYGAVLERYDGPMRASASPVAGLAAVG